MKLYFALFSFIIMTSSSLTYEKYYFDNGQLKAEGWIEEGSKERYWFYYYPNGSLKSKGNFKSNTRSGYWYYYDEKGLLHKEGHYEDGVATSWWRYYHGDTIETVILKQGNKEGLALYKVDGKPVKAEYYKNDRRTHEWYSLADYRKDKPDLERL